jgi:hypothetical protein
MPLLSENVPECHRATLKPKVRESKLRDACLDLGRLFPGLRDAGKITLDVGRKDRNADMAKALSHNLQRYCFASAGSARNQTMAI